MKLSFHGAAGEVTGSCNLLDTGQQKILVDCGMFQGSHFNEDKNHEPLPFDPSELSAVIVTHAHLDHTGRLPLLIRGGFTGNFYATPATIELTKLVLEDALHIMNENNLKYGTPVLYDSADVAAVEQSFKPLDYHEEIKREGVFIKFHDAGHIFGSAFAEIQAAGKKIIFSGDIGNVDVPLIRDTDALPKDADVLVCESTYGNRLHEPSRQRYEIIEGLFKEALGRGGVLMIPSFALERTQELLYALNDLIDVKNKLPRVPIFLDSPLAINATQVYRRHTEYYDREATELLLSGDDLFQFPGLKMTATREESKTINAVPSPKIIIAGAGMMNGGRIQHHAMRYLPDKNSTLLIIGYQSVGTVGRRILDGAPFVKIFGEKIPVKCRVQAIGALSAHADQKKLLEWIGGAGNLPKKIILNHGEPEASAALAAELAKRGAIAEVAAV